MLTVLGCACFIAAAILSFTRSAGLTPALIAAGLAPVTLPGLHLG